MEVLNKIKSMLKEHLVLVISILICIFLGLVGGSISGSAKKDYNAVYDQLTKVNNQITQTSTTNQEVVYVVESLENGLDKSRWAADDTIITEWIYDAFNFDSASEYNQNREIYVNRLGASDDFVINVMPPYIAGYTELRNENSEVDDGNSINMHITGFKSYVDKIEDDKYSYVAVVTCASTSKSGYTGSSNVILTYTIKGDGSVVNFHASTPSTIKS